MTEEVDVSEMLTKLWLELVLRPARGERGDVPGWVLITLMTAIVVAALTPFVSDELRALLTRAFAMVSG